MDRQKYAGIHINYEADVAHVFAEAIVTMMTVDGDLSILSSAGLENATGRQEWRRRADPPPSDFLTSDIRRDEQLKRREDLPSWAPDFTQDSSKSLLEISSNLSAR